MGLGIPKEIKEVEDRSLRIGLAVAIGCRYCSSYSLANYPNVLKSPNVLKRQDWILGGGVVLNNFNVFEKSLTYKTFTMECGVHSPTFNKTVANDNFSGIITNKFVGQQFSPIIIPMKR